MASMRDIKRRKGSIQSTQQITKAMKLVSTVKLQRTKQRALNSKAYFSYMYSTIQSIMSKAGTINHSYVTGNESDTKAVIVIQMVGVAKCAIPVGERRFDDGVVSPFRRLGVDVEHRRNPDVAVAILALEATIELNHAIVPIGFQIAASAANLIGVAELLH